MEKFPLSSLPWTLRGYMPNAWMLGGTAGFGLTENHEAGPFRITLPGSVQRCLRENGLLPDWNIGFNARQAEWVENRDWVISTVLPAERISRGQPVMLKCLGLDSHGEVRINGKIIGGFRNAFVPHSFDLTSALTGGNDVLEIIFTEIPRFLGQIGHTSRIKDWKPRFNYGWDWTSRFVQIGIWDEIFLEIGRPAETFSAVRLTTEADASRKAGTIGIQSAAPAGAARIRLRLCQGSDSRETEISPGALRESFAWTLPDIEPWWPNLYGRPALYELSLEALDENGQTLARFDERVGFKQIEWRACAGAAPDADPWQCVINGAPVFLQGVNWTPVRPNFADVTEAEIRERLQTYAGLGCNLMRVWGGAVLEREVFFRLCDELGILVWQEFPLSSSGPDNWPPEEPGVIEQLGEIARSYVRRRRHHASLLMWCGGNELQGSIDGGKTGAGQPATTKHPLLRRFQEIVAEEDPGHRFLPTSASGPRFMARSEDYGKNLHWDVHGPWARRDISIADHESFEEQWRKYWAGDDALFRSETGFPGASPAELIRATAGECDVMPASGENPLWQRSPWWLQWKDFLEDHGREPRDLEEFVTWSQELQAFALSTAARACKDRFPGIGGILFWMGHDSFPCAANTSILDFNGNPKPAALALGEIFREPPRSGRKAPGA